MTFLESPIHPSTSASSWDDGDIHLPGVVGTSDTDEWIDEEEVVATTGDPTRDADEIGCGPVDSALVDAKESDEMDSILTN